MANCGTCKKDFHHCSSCDSWYSWESEYCSEKCWLESEEYKNISEKSRKIIQAIKEIPFEIKKDLLEILLEDDDRIGILSDLLEKEIKENERN